MHEHKSRCCEALVFISGRHGGRTLRVYCSACQKLQDTYRTGFRGWSEADLDDLDAKFDALVEHFGLEFVFERVSDGSDVADKERLYVRNKNK
jgi:hypothetical protein